MSKTICMLLPHTDPITNQCTAWSTAGLSEPRSGGSVGHHGLRRTGRDAPTAPTLPGGRRPVEVVLLGARRRSFLLRDGAARSAVALVGVEVPHHLDAVVLPALQVLDDGPGNMVGVSREDLLLRLEDVAGVHEHRRLEAQCHDLEIRTLEPERFLLGKHPDPVLQPSLTRRNTIDQRPPSHKNRDGKLGHASLLHKTDAAVCAKPLPGI